MLLAVEDPREPSQPVWWAVGGVPKAAKPAALAVTGIIVRAQLTRLAMKARQPIKLAMKAPQPMTLGGAFRGLKPPLIP